MDRLKINELLKEKNLTFGQLADCLGIKRTTLLYQLDHDVVSFKYLIAIANVLKVNVSNLFVKNDQETRISGYIYNSDTVYDFSSIDDFVAFLDLLTQFGLDHEIYIQEL